MNAEVAGASFHTVLAELYALTFGGRLLQAKFSRSARGMFIAQD
jgi:hypothetical protein